MRYIVNARVLLGKESDLLHAIKNNELGRGSIAGNEYQHDMQHARQLDDGTVTWVETCFCLTPLEEERSYWEEYFELRSIRDAHNRKNCRHENGTESWACGNCDCTRKLETRLASTGSSFLASLEESNV